MSGLFSSVFQNKLKLEPIAKLQGYCNTHFQSEQVAEKVYKLFSIQQQEKLSITNKSSVPKKNE